MQRPGKKVGDDGRLFRPEFEKLDSHARGEGTAAARRIRPDHHPEDLKAMRDPGKREAQQDCSIQGLRLRRVNVDPAAADVLAVGTREFLRGPILNLDFDVDPRFNSPLRHAPSRPENPVSHHRMRCHASKGEIRTQQKFRLHHARASCPTPRVPLR
jgi:hypothetical protein